MALRVGELHPDHVERRALPEPRPVEIEALLILAYPKSEALAGDSLGPLTDGLGGDRRGDCLEDDREGAGLLQGERAFDELGFPAVTDEELEPGLIAVATPVRGYDGAVVAALSVSGPTTRMNRDGLPAMAGYCAEEAAALSAVLGYRQRGARQSRKAGAA